MSVDDGEVWCEVSDDEMYNPGKAKKGTWEPKAEDILKVFEQLKEKKVLELHWKCPSRRPPDSDEKEEDESKEEQTTPAKIEEKKQAVPNEFDFDDDDFGGTKTVLTPRRTPGSAPKSQKKEARMDKILKDMMQQRKLQAAEREARKQAAAARSPRAPSSPGRARIASPAGSPRTPNRQSPVRLPVGPSDPISTTPVRGPTEMPTGTRLQKPSEPNVASTSQTSQSAEFHSINSITSLNTQVSVAGALVQTGTGTSVPSSAGNQPNGTSGGNISQQTALKEVANQQQLGQQPQQGTVPSESGGGVPASVKAAVTDTVVEKMDTS